MSDPKLRTRGRAAPATGGGRVGTRFPLCSVALILSVMLFAPSIALAETDQDGDLAQLLVKLQRHPEDADIQLKLATLYSWRGKRREARTFALRVIKQAPEYWDAHVLVARLDAWEGRYAHARRRLRRILKRLPEHLPATMLLADVEIWSNHPQEARRIIRRLKVEERSAGAYYRLAKIALLEMRTWKSYLLNRQALDLDPVFKPAMDLMDNLILVFADLAYTFELIDGDELFDSHGEILTVTFLPRSFLSVVLSHELLYRYDTLNSRLSLQVDWRLSRELRITGFGGFGLPAHLIAEGTGSLRVAYQLFSRWDMALGYTYDYFADTGHLNRIRWDNGLRFPLGFRLEVGYILGLLVDKETADMHSVHTRVYWDPGWIEIYLQYAYGKELYYPTPYLRRWKSFYEISSHAIGFQVMGDVAKRFTLRGGYDIQLRENNTTSHLFHFAGRIWF